MVNHYLVVKMMTDMKKGSSVWHPNTQMSEWKNFPDILNQCHWIVVERKPHTKKKAVRVLHQFEKQSWLVGVDTSFKLVTTDAPEVSSSEIRKKSPSQTGIPAVDDYIHSHHLYQEK